MDTNLPAHHENSETLNTDPVFIFDVDMIPLPPGTKARKRPPGREREIPAPDDDSTSQNPPEEK